MAQTLIEGWTEPVRTKLLVDGDPAPVSGKTYKIYVTDRFGVTGTVDTNAAGSGLSGCSLSVSTVGDDTVAAFTPASGTLLATNQPYRVRFQNVTDGYFLPNTQAGERWQIFKA
jgi:hypothetical protein